MSNRYAALENFIDYEDINKDWENIEDNIKTSAKEILGVYKFKQHKQWFDEERSVFFLNQRKLA